MFWFNALLFGVALGFFATWLWNEEYCGFAGCVTAATTVYGFVYFILGLLFLTHININTVKECMADSGCDIIYMFTGSQAMINSLPPEIQQFLGVQEKFCGASIVMCITLILMILLLCYKNEWVSFPCKRDYHDFSSYSYNTIQVPYKFKTFHSAYQALAISKSNPFIYVEKLKLIYRDGNKYYKLKFSYFDYLQYRLFLRRLRSEKTHKENKQEYKDALKRTMEFNEILQAKLKEEGRRPFEDLMQCQKKGNIEW